MSKISALIEASTNFKVLREIPANRVDESSESDLTLALEIGRKILAKRDDAPVAILELDEGWAITGGSHVLLVNPPNAPSIAPLPEKCDDAMDDEEPADDEMDDEEPSDDEEGDDEESDEEDDEMDYESVLAFPVSESQHFLKLAETLGLDEDGTAVDVTDGIARVTLPAQVAKLLVNKIEGAVVEADEPEMTGKDDLKAAYSAGGSQVGGENAMSTPHPGNPNIRPGKEQEYPWDSNVDAYESLDEKKLSYKEREKLPASAFALPETREYPIHDIAHARNALARVSANGSSAEQKIVKAAVFKRYPELKETLEADFDKKRQEINKEKIDDQPGPNVNAESVEVRFAPAVVNELSQAVELLGDAANEEVQPLGSDEDGTLRVSVTKVIAEKLKKTLGDKIEVVALT